MNVLSCFDGISAGQLALERAGIKVDNYYASEKDKYVIRVAQKNFPNTIQLGDVNGWKEWNLPKIDLLLAGSPCTNLSRSGDGTGLEGSQSSLFYRFVEILKYYKPKYFLLENVTMKKEWEIMITHILGVNPIVINSSLVSAQTRTRLYWTNIPNISQPEDRHIYLKDIILSGSPIFDKSNTIDAHYYKSGSEQKYYEKMSKGEVTHQSERRLQVVEEVLPNLLLSEKALSYMDRATRDGRNHWDFHHYSDIRKGKSQAVVANFFKGVPYNVFKDKHCIRMFAPVECERLQTFPDGFTDVGISKTQRYKAIGNSWTVDVIVHILKNILLEDNK